MYENGVYICISWYSKICWFWVKRCYCQQNSKGVSRDLFIFWSFFGCSITVPSFIIVGYVWHILEKWDFLPPLSHPLPWAVPKRSILNRTNCIIIFNFFVFIWRIKRHRFSSICYFIFNITNRYIFIKYPI